MRCKFNPARRSFHRLVAASALTPLGITDASADESDSWHLDIAREAKLVATDEPLRVLIPVGSGANVNAALNQFKHLSGVSCEVTEVPVDDINVEMILRNSTDTEPFDVALPATFGIPDLVEAQAIYPLDEFANRFEPASFSTGQLYRKGDFYQDRLYGYQTDGDAYMLFYNKQMLEDPGEQKAFESSYGRPLQVATTWRELDEMMAFFHRPEQDQFGGCLFRNSGYLAWEWWARAHAKGIYPVADDLTPNIDSEAGIAALQELIAASSYQTPAARQNGLFENWEDFSKGNVFCNIGWGGTQKHLMTQSQMRNNLVHTALPGIEKAGAPTSMGYFNWGWNYTVSSQSPRKQLSYLFALFCVSPVISTLAVREGDGYFDPFHQSHYTDPEIVKVYGRSFLDAHQKSMQVSIPDFYLRGQGKYMDALRQQLVLALEGETTPEDALKTCAKQWNHITRKLGRGTQQTQWQSLKESYPASIKSIL